MEQIALGPYRIYVAFFNKYAKEKNRLLTIQIGNCISPDAVNFSLMLSHRNGTIQSIQFIKKTPPVF